MDSGGSSSPPSAASRRATRLAHGLLSPQRVYVIIMIMIIIIIIIMKIIKIIIIITVCSLAWGSVEEAAPLSTRAARLGYCRRRPVAVPGCGGGGKKDTEQD